MSLPGPKTAHHPRLIMIAQHVVWPCTCWQGCFHLINDAPDILSGPGNSKEEKIERQMQLIKISPIVGRPLASSRTIELPNTHTRSFTAIAIQQLAQFAMHMMNIGMTLIKEMDLI